MDVHNESIAVASIAQDHGAAVPALGTMGTRQGDLDQLLRTMPSQAKPLLVIYAAGPCGDWLSRYRTNTGYDCWVVALALLPQKADDRVKTDRRDARHLARLARSGDRTAVSVPKVDDEAMRDRSRAREEARSDRKDATLRLPACVLRHDIRDTGCANGGPAHLRWRSAVVCPTPAQHMVLQAYGRAVTEHTARLGCLEHERHEQVTAWR